MAKFEIVIVGGGLVGFGAAIGLARKGHKITLFEASASLQVVGDAIAILANQQKILKHYGILNEFQKEAVEDLGNITHLRFNTGEVISTWNMEMQQLHYDHPSYIISRQMYQRFLYKEAVKLGVEVVFDRRVQGIEDSAMRPAVTFKEGTSIEADLVIGADGVKSMIRKALYPSVELRSESSCYRAVVPHELCKGDPELAPLLSGINFYMGPDTLIVQANMTDIEAVSLNMHHAGDTGLAADWKAPGDIGHLRETFKDFSPAIRKLLSMVDECIVWRVVQVPSLPSWVSPGGRIVLIGDAAHAMTPHQGQGCAQGFEDGAALSECLDRAKSFNDIPALLQKFEQARKPRAELIARTSAILAKMWMLPDGTEQEQRDDIMRKTKIWSAGGWDGRPLDEVPDSYTDPLYQPWVMGHNAVAYTNRYLDAHA